LFKRKDDKSGTVNELIYLESIEQLENDKEMANIALQAAQDSDISISSANPYQTLPSYTGNWFERKTIRETSQQGAKRLSICRALIYDYALRNNYELKFSEIANDIFSRIRQRVDSAIGKAVPDAINKLSAAYDNLRSDNSEDWSNAVHSCRRILQTLADVIYPPREDIIIDEDGQGKTIKLGKENYINRIIAFVQERSKSSRFSSIVGTHLKFFGERLDSIFKAAQKGSHSDIVSIEEADRYVIYTYLMVGDVLTLLPEDEGP
jgi:hypothetical protein